MNEMTVLKLKKVISAMKAKGFVEKNKDHKFFYLVVDGKYVGVHTKVSHGSNEINDFHINQMSKQIGIKKKQFVDLVDCSFSKNDLINYLGF